MTVRYAVTFEFDTRPPLTHRGTVAALAEGTCASRAIKEAKRVLRPVNWSSLVCVLLERVQGEPEALAETVADLDEEVPDLGEPTDGA